MNKKLLIIISIIGILILCVSCCIGAIVLSTTEEWQKIINEQIDNDTITDNNTDEGFEDKSETDLTATPQETTSSVKYAVIISGESNDSQHYTWFKNSSAQAFQLLRKYGYKDENIYYLFESAIEANVDKEATLKNLEDTILELSHKVTEKDNLLFIFIGHGGFDGVHSSYALSDTNIRDDKLAAMFSILKYQKLVVVMSPCNTGGFADDLSGPNTIFISSTRADESNRAAFIEPFLSAFEGAGDKNNDGKVSFAEAFNYASQNVENQYINNHWGVITEHAQLDDNGDEVSHEAPIPNGGDGSLAGNTVL